MDIDPERIAAEQAPLVANALLAAARHGGTEADFRREAARVFEEAGTAAGLTIIPRDEFSVARGRVDSVYNRLVLEYKRPGILKPSNGGRPNIDAIQQVKDYVLDVAKRERREAHRLAGVVTDGFHFIFVRRVGEGWSDPEVFAVNAATTERLLRLLFALATGAALVPENLVEDFGPQNVRAKNAVRALYRAQFGSKNPLVGKLFEQWRQFFSEATDYKEWAERIESKPEFRAFVGSLWSKEEIRHLDAARVFFVLHTYYALLIKLVASLAAARFAGAKSAPLSQLAAKTGDDLKKAFAILEHGGLFYEYGIRNFLEGDFFGWYLAAWDHDVEDAVRSLLSRLAEYDPGTLELAPENARDLLKKLYHYLLPREIRHDLGEYYTPDWLAERLIRQTLGNVDLGDPTKRVLDPACGSGTFLVLLINHIREKATKKGRDPAQTLELILQNVVGFDLNPLAVIAARTNYLLALGDLLKARKGEIDIPVYQADSVLTPSRGTDMYEGNVFPLKTAVGVFRVPDRFANRERMDALANLLDEAVEDGIGEKAFLSRIEKSAHLEPEELEAIAEDLRALYRQLRELHDQGLNGVWARIIKNSFAPVFIDPCHYVVGNPPWVNWEHLPDEYRRSTMPLWEHYKLFPKREKAMDTILGAAKYDISMLMTYVAADRYLKHRGKLGFVLSQSLFKSSSAGQGFRRFLLPDKTPIGPSIVEDMVELKPFEGAANRTSVAVFIKAHPVRYPVSYSYWKKRNTGRGSGLGFDTPYEEITKEKITFRQWYAEPVNRQDSTSSWITGRRKALQALHRILNPSAYQAREGTNTGGANAVFWVDVMGERPGGLLMITNVTERAKRKVQQIQAAIESELVYPLLRGSEIARWVTSPKINIILTHEKGQRLNAIPEQRMQADYPKAYAYLKRLEPVLRARKTQVVRRLMESGPFYSLFAMGDYTFAPWKVVWRELGNEVDAAVIGELEVRGMKKTVVPDHTCILVECLTKREAHFLCAVINSSPARLAIRNYIVLHPDPHVLENVNIPKFSGADATHIHLADLSEAAHKAAKVAELSTVKKTEEEIDRWAAKLWGLSNEELVEINRSLEEM